MKYVIALTLQVLAMPALAHHSYDAALPQTSDQTATWLAFAALALVIGMIATRLSSQKT